MSKIIIVGCGFRELGIFSPEYVSPTRTIPDIWTPPSTVITNGIHFDSGLNSDTYIEVIRGVVASTSFEIPAKTVMKIIEQQVLARKGPRKPRPTHLNAKMPKSKMCQVFSDHKNNKKRFGK